MYDIEDSEEKERRSAIKSNRQGPVSFDAKKKAGAAERRLEYKNTLKKKNQEQKGKMANADMSFDETKKDNTPSFSRKSQVHDGDDAAFSDNESESQEESVDTSSPMKRNQASSPGKSGNEVKSYVTPSSLSASPSGFFCRSQSEVRGNDQKSSIADISA